ncbi:MAG: glycerate kinase type-2 family protein [Gammaproteobacteria bacterium]
MPSPPRELLTHCLHAALAAVDGRRVTAAALAGIALPRGCPVLAVGKAAPAMLAGAAERLGDRSGPALCITRAGTARPGEPGADHARVLFGDHPVPGALSLAAGQELLAFLDRLPPDVPLLCLWSGGSSALVEALPEGVSPEDLARANRWLLGSGLAIDAVNRVRARLSRLKAGRLAQRLAGRAVTVLAISDVPGDAPDVIGSGPWTPPPRPLAGGWPSDLPAWLVRLLASAPPEPAPGDTALAAVDYRVVANGRLALGAAAEAARTAGVSSTLHETPLQGAVEDAADRILAAVAAGEPGLHAWSGETTVRLPPSPGAGGRNSHLALALACALDGREDVVALCAATDGSDGTGEAAGGWADGGVVGRGRALGLDARDALARADSGSFLGATGDALVTGPTGTNVMDLVFVVKEARAEAQRGRGARRSYIRVAGLGA